MRKRALLPVALVTAVAAAALLGLADAVALAGKARAVTAPTARSTSSSAG